VALKFITATHDTTGRTTHHHRTHGGIDEGVPPKIELKGGSTAIPSAIIETPEDDL
jgi:hypothetical protein